MRATTLQRVRQGVLVLAGLVCLGAAQAQLTELYVPANGTPGSQGWLPLIQGTAGNTSWTTDAFVLDTMADPNTQHGYFRFSPVALDTSLGFMLTFNLRVDGHSTSSVNRGGFSLVLIGDDAAKSLELVFSTNEVFAYDYVAGDDDRFVRGASTSYSVGAPHSYVLRVANDAYVLNIDGQDLLSGNLVDYTPQGLPYTTPNFVFFGDDTSRAAANVSIGPLVLTAVPEAASAWMWLVGLLALGGVALRRRARAQRG